ncbi:MAG: hypothetical protein AAGF92_01880 [Myxococcota bacterium]
MGFPPYPRAAAVLAVLAIGCANEATSLDAEGLAHEERLELEDRAGFESSTRLDLVDELTMASDEETLVVSLARHRTSGETPGFIEIGALAVFARDADGWEPADRLTVASPPSEELGAYVAVDDGTILASLGGSTGIAGPATRIAVFEQRSRTQWELVDVLEDVGCIAGLAMEGSTAVVADRCPADAGGGDPAAGRLRILRTDGSSWRQHQDISISRTSAINKIGSFNVTELVVIERQTIALGVPFLDVEGPSGETVSRAGVVVVFRGVDGEFVETQVLESPTPTDHGFFGETVAISGDTMAVSARGDDDYMGRVYVFEREADGWTEAARLQPSNREWVPHFGWDLALRGSWIVVGAPLERSRLMGINGSELEPYDGQSTPFGAAYAFERRNGQWEERYYIKDRLPRENHSSGFGSATALVGDSLLVGASGKATPGYVHVWTITR